MGNVHMRYAFDAYRHVALSCAALVFFIIVQYLVSLIWSTHRLRAEGKRAVERLRKLRREEPSEPEPAVSTEEPLSVSAEVQPIVACEAPSEPEPIVSTEEPLLVGAAVQPILAREAWSEPEPAVSTEEPLLVGAEVQPILACEAWSEPEPAVSTEEPLSVSAEIQPIVAREEPSEPEPAVSTGEPLSVGVEIQPILAREEPSDPEPAVSTELPLQVGSKVRAVCKFGSVTEGSLGIITGVANVRFSWQSPAFLCTFTDNMKVRAHPKNIEAFNHEHSLEELEQPDFRSVLSQRMTLRAQRLLSQQRPTRLPFAGRTEVLTKLAEENKP